MGSYIGDQYVIQITYPNTDFTDVVSIDFLIRKPVSQSVDIVRATIDSVIGRQASYSTTQDYFNEYGVYIVHPKFTYTDGFTRKGVPVEFTVDNEFGKN